MVHARGRQDRPYKDIASPVQWRIIITMLLPLHPGAVLRHKQCECSLVSSVGV